VLDDRNIHHHHGMARRNNDLGNPIGPDELIGRKQQQKKV